ncbi:FKBP-type peptidyl-prolyl cis-trans isomerase [Desulfolithobacter sp.]
MNISEGKQVSIEYTVTLDTSETIDTNVGQEPLTYTQGAGEIIPGLEKAVEGMTAGESMTTTIDPEDAYGPTNPEALVEVPRDHLPPEAWEVGAQLRAEGPDGQTVEGVVAELRDETAIVDFNHPLAGKTLHFEVKIIDVQ